MFDQKQARPRQTSWGIDEQFPNKIQAIRTTVQRDVWLKMAASGRSADLHRVAESLEGRDQAAADMLPGRESVLTPANGEFLTHFRTRFTLICAVEVRSVVGWRFMSQSPPCERN